MQHDLTYTWKGPGGQSIIKTISQVGDGEDNRDIDIPNGTSNLAVDYEIDISQLKMFVMVCNKALTIKTNSSGSPQETIVLVADKPFVWVAGAGIAIPFAGDVTTIFLSNASGAAAVLNIRTLIDATP